MNAAKVVLGHEQCHSAFQVVQLLRESEVRCRAFTSCRCPVAPGGGTGPTVSVLSFVGRVPPRGAGFGATDNCGMHRKRQAMMPALPYFQTDAASTGFAWPMICHVINRSDQTKAPEKK